MSELSGYGGLLLATRLRRISDLLFAGVDAVYRDHGVEVPSRAFPILLLLRDHGSLGVSELATVLGQTHSAVSQMSRVLADHGVLAEHPDPADERRRLLRVSPKGAQLLRDMDGIWRSIVSAVADLGEAARLDVPVAVSALEDALSQRTFSDRIAERLRVQEREAVEIIDFHPRYRDDFKRLNVEWLEKHFYVEALDHQVLSHPEAEILAPGGFVFLARSKGEIVGTCALMKAGRSAFELSKMAVTERYQGLGIGRRLLSAAISCFEQTGARRLFLESNSKLTRALTLYEAHGFRFVPRPKGGAHYQRADVYMEYGGSVRAPASRGSRRGASGKARAARGRGR